MHVVTDLCACAGSAMLLLLVELSVQCECATLLLPFVVVSESNTHIGADHDYNSALIRQAALTCCRAPSCQ
jgi:hypothetical protein